MRVHWVFYAPVFENPDQATFTAGVKAKILQSPWYVVPGMYVHAESRSGTRHSQVWGNDWSPLSELQGRLELGKVNAVGKRGPNRRLTGSCLRHPKGKD